MTTELVEEEELQDILGMPRDGHCAVVGCENDEIDERGAVYIMSEGIEHEVAMCTPHWEGIFMVLGEQTHPSESDPDGLEAEKYASGVNLLKGLMGPWTEFGDEDDAEPELSYTSVTGNWDGEYVDE